MAQHDQVINNNPGTLVIADINAALAAIFSSSSGDTEPTKIKPGQLWFDTYLGVINVRNADNSGWLPIQVGFDPDSIYTKTQADARFALQSNVYTKTQADGQFALISGTPTKAQVDTLFSSPLVDTTFAATATPTAKAHFDTSNVAAGQDRAIRVPDKAGLAIGGWELIADDTITAGNIVPYLNLGAFQILQMDMEYQNDTVAGGLSLAFSKDNGATWISVNCGQRLRMYSNGSGSRSGDFGSLVVFPLMVGSTFGTASAFRTCEWTIHAFNKANRCSKLVGHIGDFDNPGNIEYQAIQYIPMFPAEAYNAIRLQPNVTNALWSGRITLHGIRG